MQSAPDHAQPESTPAAIDPAGMRVIWLLIVAAFVAILNETTMGIAIPHLNEDLGLAPELGQWLTSAFMLTMAVVIPVTGFLLQRFTTRQMFLAAMTLFSLGTLLALIAPGFPTLLAGRIVQASGTAILMPLLMTTIMNVIPAHSRGRMMGRVGLVISLAPALGPTLAGLVLDNLHWRWIFGLVLPIALAALAIGARWMLNLGETRRTPIDILSIPLAALGFGGLVFGLTQFGSEGEGSSSAVAGGVSLAVSLIALALFVWRQLVLVREDRALLDLRVFQSRNYAVAVGLMTLIALAMFGTLTLLPLFLQDVVGVSAVQAGLVVLPGSIAMGLLGPVIGRIYDRVGPRPLIIPATLAVLVALATYSQLPSTSPLWVFMAVQMVLSVGLAASFTPLFSASLGSLPRRLYSHGSAMLNTLQQVGGAAGVALLVAVYSSAVHAGEADGVPIEIAGVEGADTAFMIAAGFAVLAAIGAWFIVRPEEEVDETVSDQVQADAETPGAPAGVAASD